ncbi:cytochrome P450 71D8-like [Pyrus ussuriensis x Pyrus communis]|uniref:Cytochrome P450 71D8-like n=1 Tax=Pyrus ussuriensis x Pyrus communis TaxID=2448454 RepID=A0A5N5H105_9ROSA|nr:cytochrome P450 71D8-like [Pyrus ussuriensis x Pyrus communis]
MSLMLNIQISFLAVIIFTCLVALVILVICWKMHTTSIPTVRLPPGPWKLPLIGNLHQMAASSLPHRCITDLANKYGPIMHLKLGQLSAIVISSPEFVQEVLKTHDVAFSQRPKFLAVEILSYNLSGFIVSPYNDFWRQMRKICVLELLSAKRVESFASIREEEASNLVQSISLSEGHPFNLSEMIFSMQSVIIARAAFGKKCKYQQEFLSLLQDTVRLTAEFDVPDLFPSLKFLRYAINLKPAVEKVHQKMDKIFDEIISDHRVKRNEVSAAGDDHQEDIVDVLLRLQESGELQIDLTTTQIKAVTLDMFSAGSETSATTTEWAMAELLRSPRAMKKAQAEVRQLVGGKGKIEESDIKKLDYLKLVIRETLRLHTPPLIPRQAREKCTIGGYDIPTEAIVLINAWGIGRDPKYWEDADCFLPERFQGSSIDFRGTNFELVPFGGGRRMCPGISFATASIELALSHLLYHFDWKLPNANGSGNETKLLEELDMTECKGLNVRKKNNLHLVAIPFISSSEMN